MYTSYEFSFRVFIVFFVSLKNTPPAVYTYSITPLVVSIIIADPLHISMSYFLISAFAVVVIWLIFVVSFSSFSISCCFSIDFCE